jgi:hypothetical protein
VISFAIPNPEDRPLSPLETTLQSQMSLMNFSFPLPSQTLWDHLLFAIKQNSVIANNLFVEVEIRLDAIRKLLETCWETRLTLLGLYFNLYQILIKFLVFQLLHPEQSHLCSEILVWGVKCSSNLLRIVATTFSSYADKQNGRGFCHSWS